MDHTSKKLPPSNAVAGGGNGGSSNKIRDIVRLRQLLKKWKKVAATNSAAAAIAASETTSAKSSGKSINKFLKKTLSFTDRSDSGAAAAADGGDAAVPKGCLAVQCVEKSGEFKRFIIPTEYLAHQLFGELLREAEEEFGFQTEGILKIPCEFDVFEKILKAMQNSDAGKRAPAVAPPPAAAHGMQPVFQIHSQAAGIPPQTQMCR